MTPGPSAGSARRVGRLLTALLLAVPLAGTAAAAEWSRYLNPRFGYGVDVPPGFSPISEAENGDGGRSMAAAGNATLSVWGGYLAGEAFVADVGSRIASDAGEGWAVGYRAVTAGRSTWSATRNGRIVYTRGIPLCRDAAAFVRLEYDASAKLPFDPIVARVARSLRGTERC